MNFGLYGVGLGAMASTRSADVARLAEQLGYESLWTGEHMVLPDPQRPPSHRSPDHPFLDPLVALTYLAACTTTIRLGTGVLLLPQRHPVHLAKELASLDLLSAGRLIVGVGVGYLEPEMRVLGVESGTRGRRTDESIRVMRTLWRDARPRFQGEFFQVDGVLAAPRPVQPGGPRIIAGGNTDAGLRRAVVHADGWYGFGLDLAEAHRLIGRLRELCAQEGRSDVPEITVTPATMPTRAGIDEFADIGVDRLVVIAEGNSIADVVAVAERYAPSQVH